MKALCVLLALGVSACSGLPLEPSLTAAPIASSNTPRWTTPGMHEAISHPAPPVVQAPAPEAPAPEPVPDPPPPPIQPCTPEGFAAGLYCAPVFPPEAPPLAPPPPVCPDGQEPVLRDGLVCEVPPPPLPCPPGSRVVLGDVVSCVL